MTWKRIPWWMTEMCDGRCRTDIKSRAAAGWKLELLDRPAGCWCDTCKRAMTQAYRSATGGEP